MDYLKNLELKFTLRLLVVLGIISIVINLMFISISFNNLKKNYILTEGAILSKIEAISPESVKDVVPVITKEVSEEDVIRGEKILKEYGFNTNLDVRFIPSYYKVMKNISLSLVFIWIFLISITISIVVWGFKKIYKKMRALKKDIEDLLDGKVNIDIDETLEGDIGKLSFTFNDIRKRLKSNIESLNSEKVFLINLLSDISHQLKTPLSSLTLFNDILIEREEEITIEERSNFLNNSRIQLIKMDWLIKSLLKLAKIDAGAIIFNKKYQSLNKTIEKSIEVLYGKIIEKNINMIFNEESFYMNHDNEWLSEAFINIIKNSIDHVEFGGYIKISLESNSIFKRVIIEDNGCGIEKEEVKKIFARFYKNNKNKESVGIGLSLSESIIESHGGIIEVESVVNKYTKFIITFLK
ncbi:HAMP domain-containing sensor histidine kinase [Clostridium frigidicarnis]|uniref:histidine kinase n=1 Tax=Clostridium frigidicarnis TaxID=84698 RepID=A0A1I0Y9H1_9CLOT|nr:HAMP domain-containing sensor histidine kinase [Clostridium frigidicarnis]SFB09120.1 hypothetical protein SAMN04488528_101183 [Clostridium frigidicarnis]